MGVFYAIGIAISLVMMLQDGDVWPGAFIGLGVMALGAIIGVHLQFRGRRLDAKAAAERLQGQFKSSQPHVLYLRSFRTDQTGVRSLTTEEEQLAFVLQPFGLLLAVGRPGEPFPVPGGVRIYTTEAEWRTLVMSRMQSAKLTVIRAGASQGLLWELHQAFSILPPENLVILVLGLPLGDYREFAKGIRDQCHVTLPVLHRAGIWRFIFWSFRPRPWHARAGFISFGPDWSFTFTPLPFTCGQMKFNDLRKPFNLALRPIFERRGVRWHPVGRFTRGAPT